MISGDRLGGGGERGGVGYGRAPSGPGPCDAFCAAFSLAFPVDYCHTSRPVPPPRIRVDMWICVPIARVIGLSKRPGIEFSTECW